MKTALVICCAIGLFVLVSFGQGWAAAKLCENHSVGTRIDNLEDIEGSLFLSAMGPLPDRDQPGAQDVIFCASLTMCDTSCSLKIKDGLVVEAKYSAL